MKRFTVLFIAGLIFTSCQKEEFDPADSFTKIYDSFRSDLEFYPIDVTPTETGFLILAGQSYDQENFRTVQIIQLDEEGNFLRLWEDNNYAIPVGDWIAIDSTYHFFAMDPVTLQVQLITTTTDLTDPVITPTGGNLYYPLAASGTSAGNLLLLSYDIDNQQSVISTLDTDGNVVQSSGYSIGPGSEVEPLILNHYLDPERSGLPFFCGEFGSGQAYFNGFHNYSLSLVFSDFGDSPTGVIQGQGNTNGGITHAKPIQGSTFGVFGFQFNDNFIDPAAAVSTSGISSSVDLLNTTVSEFKSRTPADIEIISINEVSYTVFAAETEGRQVAIYFYDALSGELAGIHKVGYLNPYTLASITVDEENNLLVLGTTYVAGRFPRIFLTKIPQANLKDIIGN